MNRATYRLRQGWLALLPASTDTVPTVGAELLSAPQRTVFAQLPRRDRTHACAVVAAIRKHGGRDRDLLVAALLHDIGKVGFGSHVRLIDRVAKVMLGHLLPGALGWMARQPSPPRGLTGLWLAVNHPRLGAERARTLGCSDRTCWLIAHHHDRTLPDRALALLIAADEEC